MNSSNFNVEFEKSMGLSHFTIEHAPDAAFWVDKDARIRKANKMASELYEYSNEEFMDMSIFDLDPLESDESWKDRWELLRTIKILRIEKEQKTKTGNPIFIEIIHKFFEYGGLEYSCSFIRDISQRKEDLAQLKNLKLKLERENIYLKEEIRSDNNWGEIVTVDPQFMKILQSLEKVAPTDANVLILGETGTGKELIARAIHRMSLRRDKTLIKVNCASLPASLMESELFGHEKGAFTGAMERRIGRFELAQGGTLFLDEIGELPLDLQVKLLRVLQEKEMERLGSSQTIKLDVRILAATNRDLIKEVENGRFREDLYYRLNVFPLILPPLRERIGDIPSLVNHLIKKHRKRLASAVDCVSAYTLTKMKEYHWPGNIRELENIIERALICSCGKELEPGNWFDKKNEPRKNKSTLEDVEKGYLLTVLESTGWKIRGRGGAAEIVGLKPTTLEARLKRWGLTKR